MRLVCDLKTSLIKPTKKINNFDIIPKQNPWENLQGFTELTKKLSKMTIPNSSNYIFIYLFSYRDKAISE
ncbi:hypothetical protein BpHYR1_004516 [Brachionus plicatilis]|uniref:Uncharacterized protein n=1 Tax=Brachionus plicatilis TaxID=10195 RepID=A0A3M7SJ37_BRAPC|nr:hypothetical protein BpHYR1_004516 [Brachionus plicatilis]